MDLGNITENRIIIKDGKKVLDENWGTPQIFEDTEKFVSDGEREVSELRWGRNRDRQNVHYLHGALPLFDTGVEIIEAQTNNVVTT